MKNQFEKCGFYRLDVDKQKAKLLQNKGQEAISKQLKKAEKTSNLELQKLNDKILKAFNKGQQILPLKNVTVLVVNTNLYNDMKEEYADPCWQLSWLDSQLATLKQSPERQVLVSAHFSPDLSKKPLKEPPSLSDLAKLTSHGILDTFPLQKVQDPEEFIKTFAGEFAQEILDENSDKTMEKMAENLADKVMNIVHFYGKNNSTKSRQNLNFFFTLKPNQSLGASFATSLTGKIMDRIKNIKKRSSMKAELKKEAKEFGRKILGQKVDDNGKKPITNQSF